ncbi:MAG: anti-sigma factor RsbW [Acidimicrobiales bacterium]|nr:anti-sigma factor RsbW [Acidimicrobiales bacterium]
MDQVVELELPARPDVLALARLVVAAVVTLEPLFDEERIDDLRLAVSEACTNAIEAQQERGGGDADGRPIGVRCHLTAGRVEVEVRDHGGGFDHASLPLHPPVTDPARLEYERGLGIPLIRMLSDAVEFRQTEDGTAVVMVFEPRPLPDPKPVA